MKTVWPNQNADHMAKMREKLRQKTDLASSSSDSASGSLINSPEIKVKNFRLRTPEDIKRASRLMMEDLANGGSRFTVAQMRVFNDLATLFYKSDEHIAVKKRVKVLEQAARDRE